MRIPIPPKLAVVMLAIASVVVLAVLAPADAGAFAIKADSFSIVPSTRQAGAHEDLTTTFKFVHNGAGDTQGNVKTTSVELPAGFTGSNTAVPTCTASELAGAEFSAGAGGSSKAACAPDTQVGTISFTDAGLPFKPFPVTVVEPLYNMEVTNPGIAAMFGFNFSGIVLQDLPVTVRPGDLGLTITSEAIQGIGEISEVSVTVWGVPAEASHDEDRGRECSESHCTGGNESVSLTPRPFLSNPTSCAGEPLTATLKSNDWQDPGEVLSETTKIAPMLECERIPFEPSIEAQPTTNAAESPSGLDFTITNPQSWENPISVSTSNLKDAEVTLPEGFTVNPSAGSGLGACTPAQYEAEAPESLPGEGCPRNRRSARSKSKHPSSTRSSTAQCM